MEPASKLARGDLRVRRSLVDEALRLYAEMAARGKGVVVFLAGYPGSGRTATLEALAGGVSMPSSTPPTRPTI